MQPSACQGGAEIRIESPEGHDLFVRRRLLPLLGDEESLLASPDQGRESALGQEAGAADGPEVLLSSAGERDESVTREDEVSFQTLKRDQLDAGDGKPLEFLNHRAAYIL